MDNNNFIYRYSAEKNREIERIRSKYLPKDVSKLDELKKLDSKVQGAGRIEGLSVGVIGALVFGIGLCLMLGVLRAVSWLMPICLASGAVIMATAYPIYRQIARKTKKRLVPMIMKIADEILENK